MLLFVFFVEIGVKRVKCDPLGSTFLSAEAFESSKSRNLKRNFWKVQLLKRVKNFEGLRIELAAICASVASC